LSIKQWNIILVLALCGVLSGGGYVLYQNNLAQEAKLLEQAEEERLAAEQAQKDKEEAEKIAALTKEFEGFLNDFLTDVSQELREYKITRKVLVSLMQPANLRETKYIEENYEMGEATVMSLRLQMDKVMRLFETAEIEFQELLTKWPEGRGESIRQNWRSMRDEQVDVYLGYFTSEQDLLEAMQNLLSFYNEKRDVLRVDVIDDRIEFDDEEDTLRHEELKITVDALKSLQSELMK
jgi:hypothetical protein